MTGLEDSFEEVKRRLEGKRGEELAGEILGILGDGTSHSLTELTGFTKASRESKDCAEAAGGDGFRGEGAQVDGARKEDAGVPRGTQQNIFLSSLSFRSTFIPSSVVW